MSGSLHLPVLPLAVCDPWFDGQPYTCKGCGIITRRSPHAAPANYPERALTFGVCRDCWLAGKWTYDALILKRRIVDAADDTQTTSSVHKPTAGERRPVSRSGGRRKPDQSGGGERTGESPAAPPQGALKV